MTTRHAEFDAMLTSLGGATFIEALVEATGQQLLITDTAARILFCGDDFAETLGYTRAELQGQSLEMLRLPGLQEGAESRDALPAALRHKQQGTRMVGRISWSPLTSVTGELLGHLGRLLRETTEFEEALAQARSQVLEESNHRVRNNLAMICALLDMEILRAPEAERKRLLISLARTRSLALVHNLTVDGTGRVDVGMLVRAVVDTVRALFARVEGSVAITDEAACSLSTKRATYLGLALTELTVQLLQCSGDHGQDAFPLIFLARDGAHLIITVEHASCTPTACCLEAGSLSREILLGMVERSLFGTFQFGDGPTFRAIIRCPLVLEHEE